MAQQPTREFGAWFNEAKLGMFIHWGIYALLGRGEQVMFREHLVPSEYRGLADRFTVPNYDANEWAALARDAGMRYMVLTSKHHDGFCLFDSPGTDFSAPRTAAGRDLLGEYVEACREAGLRVGIYYSLQDWSWPVMFEGREGNEAEFDRFIEYTHRNIEALCSNYGKIDIMWFDGRWPLAPEVWRADEIDEMVRELQPEILITGDRLYGRPPEHTDNPFFRGDRPGYFATSERRIQASSAPCPWEVCDLTQHRWWGYVAGEGHWKTPTELVYLMAESLAQGANLLLNVGPKGDGSFPDQVKDQLSALGGFTARNAEAVYGSTGANHLFEFITTGSLTQKGNTLYLWVQWWHGEELHLCGLANEVLGARVLGEEIEVRVDREGEQVYLRGLPEEPPDELCTVIALDLEGAPEGYPWAQFRLHGHNPDPSIWAAWART